MHIELKKDEFSKIRDFITIILNQTNKSSLKVRVNKELGISWNKLDEIRTDLIYSEIMDIQKKKDLLKFLNKIISRMNKSEQLEQNIRREYKITKKQIELSIEKLKNKKELGND